MKKVLIVYATAGIGHKKASMAVKKAFDELALKDARVTIIDSLDYTNAFFKWSYLQTYLLMVNKLPTFWGLMYYLTDNFYVNIVVSKLRRISNWANSFRFRQFLIEEDFDTIVSTHFFASEVIGDMKSNGRIKSRLITVITDYMLHSWWVAPNTDFYVTAGDDTRDQLSRYGVGRDRVKVLGIPAEPVFSKRTARPEAASALGLDSSAFTVLVIGGGFGVGPIEETVKALGKVGRRIQIVAICGNNEGLVKRLETLKAMLRWPVRVLGFVDNVYQYMEASDILISKSGGITVTESLIKELPLIVISPIIGQETRNCDFLMSHSAGVRLGRVDELKDTVEELASDAGKLSRIKEAIRAIRKPDACFDIARLAAS